MTIVIHVLAVIGAIVVLVGVVIGLAVLSSVVFWSICAWRAKRDFFRAARAAGLEDEKFSVAAWRAEHGR